MRGIRIKNPIKFIIFASLFLTSIVAIYFTSFYSTNVVLREINSLSPDETTINSVKKAECKGVKKYDDYWVVDGCKDGIYFKIFLNKEGYMLGYCIDWDTPREAFLKLSDMPPIKECVDMAREDKLLVERDNYKIYEICGLKVIFLENCILGVGKL